MNWLFIGSGQMAQVMHDTLLSFEGQNVMGVYSRNKVKLEVFCNKNHIPSTISEPDELIKSNFIDAVYVSTPHNDHYDWAKWALENNKHVLVEKPATIKNKQWLHLCELAQQQNKTLLEGMWMSFFPALKQLVTIYKRGNLGSIRSIKADFCIKPKYDSSSRLWNKKLAGGAAWDLGIYNLNLLHLFFNPDEIFVESITKELSPSGVDQHNQIIFNLPKRGTAELNFSLDREQPQDAYIEFENGSCKIPNFFHTDEIIWEKQGETVTHKFEKNKNYHYQIDAFIKAIQQDEVEVKENNFKMTSDRIKWIEEYLELEVQAIEDGY